MTRLGNYIKQMSPSKLTQVRTLTRDNVVPYYRRLILTNAPDEEIVRVNKLILSKWSSSGLNYIKERAWKGIYAKLS